MNILNFKLQVHTCTCRHNTVPIHVNGGVVMILIQVWHPVFEQPCHHMKVKNDHRSKFSNLSSWKDEA